MNIQIFGSKKSNDSKKAERWFKERGIRYQFIDLKEKGMSRGELTSVMQAVGGLEALLDPGTKQKEVLILLNYLTEEDKLQKVLDYPELLRAPIVRNGKKATVGNTPEVWATWE